jgi:nucleoside-diphosphate-sugar epimerase
MSKTLVIGGSGFVGSYLMKELTLQADNMDIEEGHDVRQGIHQVYDNIIFLACDQANTREAFDYNLEMFRQLYYYYNRGITKLIYISSAAVYYGGSWYGESKRIGERYAKTFHKWIILRPSNIYGHGDGHGAPERFMRGERIIHGDGEQIRDLIPVEAVVMEICECLRTNDRNSTISNLSSGIGTSVKDMFKMFGSGKPIYRRTADVGVSESILEPGVVW